MIKTLKLGILQCYCRSLRLLVLVIFWGNLLGELVLQADSDTELVRKWVAARDALSRERAVLEEVQRGQEERLRDLKKVIAERRQQLQWVDKRVVSLTEEHRALVEEWEGAEDSFGDLTKQVMAFEGRLGRLSVLFPESLRQQLASQWAVDLEEISLGERILRLSFLTEKISDFDTKVSVVLELREGKEGARLMKTMYLGLGQAYRLGMDGKVAFRGEPGVDGWVWEEIEEVEAVAKAMRLFENEEHVPAFVALPVRIQEFGK